jgi:hypothetical protein
LKQLGRNHSVLRSERLDQLRFEHASTIIALSELAMDMVEAFSSRDELIWIQNGLSQRGNLVLPNRRVNTSVLKHRLIQIVEALDGSGSSMVIGAFALPAWGRPRATLDLDFIIQTTEVPEELVRKLADLGFHFDDQWDRYNPMIRTFHKRFRCGRTPVDLLLKRDEHDGSAFLRRRKKLFEGRYLWFPSAEDLLLQKLKVGRPQDFIDAVGIVERMRGRLDQRYLARWAKKLGITAELAHVNERPT